MTQVHYSEQELNIIDALFDTVETKAEMAQVLALALKDFTLGSSLRNCFT